jgi:primosomal protein N' (replication factor Y)
VSVAGLSARAAGSLISAGSLEGAETLSAADDPAAVDDLGPIALIAVDIPLASLDRLFDYAVPPELSAAAQVGCRVKVRFHGRQVSGWVIGRQAASDHPGKLMPIVKVVSPEPALTPQIAQLCRAVADRYAGTLADVLRTAVPPRHARVEKENPAPMEPTVWTAAGPDVLATFHGGPEFLASLAAGGRPRAVWSPLPGPQWPEQIAAAVAATRVSGRGALVVVPSGRESARVTEAVIATTGQDSPSGIEADVVELTADLGPADRYRRFLRAARGQARVVIGTRAATFAPVADLGLVVIWDDGDDLHSEPHAPYWHARDVLLQRAHEQGAAVLIAGFTPSVEATVLLRSGWARAMPASREAVRQLVPRVVGLGDDTQLARDPAARAARLPSMAWEAARAALAEGAPVLVQVPRRGYQPALACQQCRTMARCAACSGPLGRNTANQPATCRWCGQIAADWSCPECDARVLRAVTIGAGRTAEELGRSFPGVPVLTSGRDGILGRVPGEAALVVSTPGAEPIADGGYGCALLLDAAALLARPDLRAGQDALRRWSIAAALVRPGSAGGSVIVIADQRLATVQALLRWAQSQFADRELDERTALHFPPAVRMAALDGPARALATFAALLELPEHGEILGPVPVPPDRYRRVQFAELAEDADAIQRMLVRVPRSAGTQLSSALARALGVWSTRSSEPAIRVQLDPLQLV